MHSGVQGQCLGQLNHVLDLGEGGEATGAPVVTHNAVHDGTCTMPSHSPCKQQCHMHGASRQTFSHQPCPSCPHMLAATHLSACVAVTPQLHVFAPHLQAQRMRGVLSPQEGSSTCCAP